MSFSKRLLSSAPPPFVASENFNVVTWTGNDVDGRAITVGFKPDLVWIKPRTITSSNRLFNSTRGATKFVQSDTTAAEQTASNTLQSFTNTGFTVGQSSAVNDSSSTYVAWCWKANGGTTSSNTDGSITTTVQANQDSGFSIIKYDMNVTSASAFTIGHGLSAAPELIIFNSLEQSGSTSHIVYPNNPNKEIVLDSYGAFSGSTSAYWNTTAPSSTVINMGTAWGQYYSYYGGDTIAYAFHSVEGFSKIGSYTGNGSANGPITEIGFEPAFVVAKRTDAVDSWIVLDNKRDLANPRNNSLKWDETGAEEADSSNRPIDFLSNGFQIKATHQGLNANNGTYLYMAFAADPDTEAPTLASSFNIETYTGTGSDPLVIDGLGFKPGLVWIKTRDQAREHILSDIVRGPDKEISSNDTSAEEARGVKSFDNDGFTLDNATFNYNNNGEDYVAWTWEADDNEPTIFGGAAKAVYKFEDNANDVTGTYNATASNVSYVTGHFNKAAEFNGSNSTMFLASSGNSLVNYDSDFSISLWFNVSSWATETSTDFLWTGGGTRIINITLTGSTGLQADIWNSGSNLVSTTGLSENTWHHLVFIRSKANGMKLYIDGSIVDTNSYTGNAGSLSGKQDSIGTYWDNTRNNFTGKIDQFRIYDGEITDDDVTALYAETASQNDDLTLGGPPETIISANANAGMSVVKWEGAGTQTQIPHGLSAVPEMIISKRLDSTNNWSVYHKDLSLSHSTYPNWLYLNLTNAEQASSSSANHPYYARPSATVIYQNTGTSESSNVDGGNYISYCFHSVSGYSKFGSYTGNGNNDRAITTGFKPDFILIKSTVGNDNWRLYDTRRGIEGGGYLEPNRTDADDTSNAPNLTMTSTGFTITSGGVTAGNNANGNLYIYWAVAKNVPSNTTLANSFKVVTYTGNGSTQSITGFGFKPDLVWFKARTVAYDHGLYDSVRGGSSLIYPDLAQAASTVTNGISFDEDGVTVGANNKQNSSDSTYVAWAWKAGNTWQSNLDGTMPTTINANTANGFSIVKYTGQGGVKTAGHGLSSAPEMIIVKSLGHSANWYTYHIGLDASSPEDYNVRLDQTDARQDSASYWNDTAPTSSVFTIGTTTGVSQSGTDFIAYCFHSVAGFSKFGSYTGTGATGNTVTVGFQPDFVMVKSSSTTEPWFILDSVRDTSNPRDNRLMPDSSAVEDDGSVHTMAFNSTSFTLNGTLGNGTNGNGQTYIYMAFKMN